MLLLLAASAALNAAAWCSSAFADWYADVIFPIVTAPLARLTALLPFSLGEWMLLAAVLWLLLLAAIVILCIALTIAFHLHGSPSIQKDVSEDSGAAAGNRFRKSGISVHRAAGTFPCFARRFARATCWLVSIVLLVMTLNCFILYHVTPLEESLPGYGKEYTVEELGALRDYVVRQCNTLSQEMPRDEETNEVIYDGGLTAMTETARAAMANLAESASADSGAGDAAAQTSADAEAAAGSDLSSVPDPAGRIAVLTRLGGWSTTAKGLYFSDFVSQQYIQGYYFPFSMEANYNTVMKIMNLPSTICHELSHTHGFIYEDEANLIGFLACIYSDDPVFQYSGWLSVLNYVNNSFYNNVDKETYRSHAAISDLVRWDNEFLSDEAWEAVEEDAVLSTETVKAATDVYLDTTLKANGVESGKASYSHVVELLLMYFDGSLKTE